MAEKLLFQALPRLFFNAENRDSVNCDAALLALWLVRDLDPEGSCSRMRSCSVPSLGSAAEWLKAGEKWVWTLSTLWPSDCVVMVRNGLGLRMFSAIPCVCKGPKTVRVPPRAQHTPSSEGFLL